MPSRHEAELSAALAECGAGQRAVFAASCARRLFAAAQPQGGRRARREALDSLWRHLSGREMSVQALDALATRVEAAVPHEDEVEVLAAFGGLEGNALAAVALCCAPTGDPEEVAWAARQAVEALGLHAEQATPVYPRLRRELARQDRTLGELAVVDHPTSDVLEPIRQDATGVAEDFWGRA